jgi:hypothetical protein
VYSDEKVGRPFVCLSFVPDLFSGTTQGTGNSLTARTHNPLRKASSQVWEGTLVPLIFSLADSRPSRHRPTPPTVVSRPSSMHSCRGRQRREHALYPASCFDKKDFKKALNVIRSDSESDDVLIPQPLSCKALGSSTSAHCDQIVIDLVTYSTTPPSKPGPGLTNTSRLKHHPSIMILMRLFSTGLPRKSTQQCPTRLRTMNRTILWSVFLDHRQWFGPDPKSDGEWRQAEARKHVTMALYWHPLAKYRPLEQE